MNTEALLYNLREQLSCSVCKDVFTAPKQLSCLHSFCLECLKKWHQSEGGGRSVICPQCKTLTSVPPSGDLNDLPTSFYLNGLIDILAIKECNKIEVTCGDCDKKSFETSYCFKCCIFYCGKCADRHNVVNGNKGHRILAVKDFQDKDYEDVLKRPVVCSKPRHENEELKFFCRNCEMAACQTCFALEHSGHTLNHIEEEAERRKTEMKNIMETQRQNLLAKERTVKQLDEDYAKLIQQAEDVKRNVQKYVDNLISAIETKKQNIFAAVENETKKSLESLTKEKSEVENEIQKMESFLKKTDELLTRRSNIEVVQLNISLESLFGGIVQNKTAACNLEDFPALVFLQNEQLLSTVSSEEIGSLETPHQTKASQSIAQGKGLNEALAGREAQFNLITRDREKSMCYNKNDCILVQIQDQQGREFGTEVRVNDNKNGQYKISYSLNEQGRYSIVIKVNGEHICDSPYDLLVKPREQAISSGNLSSPSPSASRCLSLDKGVCSQALLVKPFKFKPVLSFGKYGSSAGMLNCPWGVAVSDRDEIAVTEELNYRVQILGRGGNYLRSLGHQGTNQEEFSNPRGICFDHNRNVFVVDNGNNRVQIFSEEGRYMGMFGGKGSLDSQLSYPCGLSLDANGNIIVADSGNKLIKIFSPDGKFVRKIGGPGSFSCSFHCVQCDEYLIVSDYSDHSIKVFTREGEYKYKFGKKGGGDGEFNHPYCLAVTKSKHLMVCDGDNHRIQVFELNGRFVGKFGTRGRNLGEFNYPRSVAVLSNGRIVVCDSSNNRIQILE